MEEAMWCQESDLFKIVCDERCPVVQQFGALVKLWDVDHKFTFVDRSAANFEARALVEELDRSQWSLLLIDEYQQPWAGPEAVPIILKNLPFGKLAAVWYILPGTMWLTRQLYMLVSRSHKRYAVQLSQ